MDFLIATYWIILYVCGITFGPIDNFYRVT